MNKNPGNIMCKQDLYNSHCGHENFQNLIYTNIKIQNVKEMKLHIAVFQIRSKI